MMYHPDRWALLKITNGDETVYKILAGFYGGFAGSNSWKLNSGVTKVEEDADLWLVYGESGSVYACRKNAEGFTALTSQMLAHWKRQAGIEVVPMQEYMKKELDKEKEI